MPPFLSPARIAETSSRQFPPTMRILLLLLKLALFLLVLTFAVRNTETVTLRYFPGWEWQSPLIFVLLIAFFAGIVLGLLAVLPRLLRQRRDIGALRRELEIKSTHPGAAERQ
ncbi:MAG TPA: LapA family protein [Burkholderiales bacterium]